jgi:predicted RNA binding protein YcfA (HicA-like mRNA interferase family)
VVASKEIRELVRQLEKQGWRVVTTRGGHLRALPPQGSAVVLPGTPSDRRAFGNAIALLRARGFVWKGR